MMIWVQVWACGMPLSLAFCLWAAREEFLDDGELGLFTLAACVLLWPLFLAALVAFAFLEWGDS